MAVFNTLSFSTPANEMQQKFLSGKALKAETLMMMC